MRTDHPQIFATISK